MFFRIMKCLTMCTLLMAAITGCKTGSGPTEPEAALSPPLGKMQNNQVYAQLDNIAKSFLQNGKLIAAYLPQRLRDREGEIFLNDFLATPALQKAFARSRQPIAAEVFDSESTPMQTRFALAKHSPKLIDPDELRVAVDMDDYALDDNGSFIAYSLDGRGKLQTETMDVETYNHTQPWPLLIVDAQPKETCLECGGGGGGSNGGTPGPYLSIRSVNLKKENDPGSYEEFEIFVREAEIPGEVLDTFTGLTLPIIFNVAKKTNLIFDGSTSRKDAAGRWRTWADINKDGTYNMTQDIALFRLTSEKKGLVPIEDDNKKGEHRNNHSEPYLNWLRVQSVYAYRHDLGQNKWDDVKFEIVESGTKDDVYSYSGAYGFTEGNSASLKDSPRTYPNSDMDLRLLREDL